MLARIAFTVALAAFASGLAACSSSRPEPRVVVVAEAPPRHGPPPHAPAHGYRHKHKDGVDLVFDAPRGVYVVLGQTHCYWHGDQYYRQRGNRWEVSVTLRGPWTRTAAGDLPGGLSAQATEPKKHGSKGKSRKD